MKSLTLSNLCEALGRPNPLRREVRLSGVSIDSRTIQPGDCFFAIAGDRFDGHDFLEEAQRKQAACVVVQKEPSAKLSIPVIRVDDTVDSLGQLAAWYRRRLSGIVIAVTGSAGKTTTRHILHHVLSRRFRCCQAPKSFNNQIGVPLTLLAARQDDEIVLVEIGSNHPGEIAPLSRMAGPDIALITHIAPAHLEGMGSVEAIIQEKASILEGLTPAGKAYINGDIPELVGYLRQHYPHNLIPVGEGADCLVRPEQMHTCGTSGWIQLEGRVVRVPMPGQASLRNTLMAWAVCRDLGVNLSDFAEAVQSASPPEMRLQVEHLGPITLLVDCYNASPASMENAVDCLARIARLQGRRSVFIAGDMMELGTESGRLHRQLGRFAARHEIAVILAAGQFAHALLEGAQETDNNCAGGRLRLAFGTVEALCNNLHLYIRPDDIILIKASRSVRLERVVGRLRELFGKEQTTL